MIKLTKKKKSLKKYTLDEFLKKHENVFSILFCPGISLFWNFKPIALVVDGESAWHAFKIEKDLICLWGTGPSKKVPWGNLELEGKLSKEYRDFLMDTRPWPTKKEEMQKVLILLKDYYSDILRLEKLSKTEKS